MPHPDIIIVGAGSAGCILANRLANANTLHAAKQTSGKKKRSILVVEPAATRKPHETSDAAQKSDWQADLQRPSQWLNLLQSSEDWDFSTEPTVPLAGRAIRWPRGRGMGGSSRINAMIWFPPTANDLAMLAKISRQKIDSMRQTYLEVNQLVAPQPPTWVSSAANAFLKTPSSRGQTMLYQRVNRQGRRWNPAKLLDDSVDVLRTSVDRLILDRDRVIGLQTIDGEFIGCVESIFLCAGSIATPTILMRSGIGPRDVLSANGIDVRADRPSVGENLQDHLIMPVIFGVDPDHRFEPIASVDDEQVWRSTGGGPIASNLAEAGGLFDNDALQIHVTPTHYLKHPASNSPAAMTIGVNVTQPASRGRLTITTSNPTVPPRIEPNYLSNQTDLQSTIQAVRLARELASKEPLASFITGELLPGTKRESDESIAKSIERFAQTLYHPVGTAADVNLPIDNLHIADASAFQRITLGNPNASVMTLACCLANANRT